MPFVVLRAKPSLPIALNINQAFSGVFESSVLVLHGDTAAALARRLARLERGIKGPVTLYR